MDQIRRVLAVVAIVVYGPGLLFWFLVHPLARFWRKLGPAITYLIVFTVLALIGLRVFQVSGTLIGRDLGTNWSLIVLGAVLLGICGWIGLAYGRKLNHLGVAARIGVPELSRTGTPQTLVRDGLYGYVRHPIYSFAIASGIAYALIVNYVGTYILFVAAVPALYAITALEERELTDRFGEPYRQYQRDVPRLLPLIRRRNAQFR